MPSRASLASRFAGYGSVNVRLKRIRLGQSIRSMSASTPLPDSCRAAAADAARQLSGKGVDADMLRIDWPSLMRFKRTFTEPYPANLLARLAREGIEVFQAGA